jgi:ABC-type antimicrobial peptide transport system permease subunit
VHLAGDIVGVIADVKQSSLSDATLPQFWAPFAQWPVGSFTVVMRTTGDPRSVAAAARNAVHEIDSKLPVTSERTVEEVVAASVARPRFYMTLLTVFSVVALLLSAIGVYGVIAYLVGQRKREIGIRVALGASRASVTRLVLGEGIAMVGAGIVLGVGGALALTQVMRRLLFEITPTDLPTYVTVITTLVAVALVATIVPARRAARVDPMTALRMDSA